MDALLLSLGFLLLGSCYVLLRSGSRRVRFKALCLLVLAVFFLCVWYASPFLADLGIDGAMLRTLLLVRDTILSSIGVTLQGTLWPLLLVANALLSTGTHLGKVRLAQAALVVFFWLLTGVLVYSAFVAVQGDLAALVPIVLPLVFSIPASVEEPSVV